MLQKIRNQLFGLQAVSYCSKWKHSIMPTVAENTHTHTFFYLLTYLLSLVMKWKKLLFLTQPIFSITTPCSTWLLAKCYQPTVHTVQKLHKLIVLIIRLNVIFCCLTICFITALCIQTLCWICLCLLIGSDLLLLLWTIWTFFPFTPPVLRVICCFILTPTKCIMGPIKQKPVNISEHN